MFYFLDFLRRILALLNIYLAYDSPWRDSGNVAHFLASQFAWFFRYIDDVLLIDCSVFNKLTYVSDSFFGFRGIYPICLRLESSPPQPRVNYLDVTIVHKLLDNRFVLSTKFFNKFMLPEFSHLTVIRFPHMASNLARFCKDNILTSRFRAIKGSVLDARSFANALAQIIRDLVHQGYCRHKLLRQYQHLCHLTGNICGRPGETIYRLTSECLN